MTEVQESNSWISSWSFPVSTFLMKGEGPCCTNPCSKLAACNGSVCYGLVIKNGRVTQKHTCNIVSFCVRWNCSILKTTSLKSDFSFSFPHSASASFFLAILQDGYDYNSQFLIGWAIRSLSIHLYLSELCKTVLGFARELNVLGNLLSSLGHAYYQFMDVSWGLFFEGLMLGFIHIWKRNHFKASLKFMGIRNKMKKRG